MVVGGINRGVLFGRVVVSCSLMKYVRVESEVERKYIYNSRLENSGAEALIYLFNI